MGQFGVQVSLVLHFEGEVITCSRAVLRGTLGMGGMLVKGLRLR